MIKWPTILVFPVLRGFSGVKNLECLQQTRASWLLSQQKLNKELKVSLWPCRKQWASVLTHRVFQRSLSPEGQSDSSFQGSNEEGLKAGRCQGKERREQIWKTSETGLELKLQRPGVIRSGRWGQGLQHDGGVVDQLQWHYRTWGHRKSDHPFKRGVSSGTVKCQPCRILYWELLLLLFSSSLCPRGKTFCTWWRFKGFLAICSSPFSPAGLPMCVSERLPFGGLS